MEQTVGGRTNAAINIGSMCKIAIKFIYLLCAISYLKKKTLFGL